jgi:hypothetical protein
VKKKRRGKSKPVPKVNRPSSNPGHIVRQLASEGISGDVIAAKLGVNKNTLRAEHALDLHAGRKIKAAEKAAAGEMSKEEKHLREVIARAFASHWQTPEGNLLFEGRDEEEAYQLAIQHPGNRWGIKV